MKLFGACLLLLASLACVPACAADPILTLSGGGMTRQFTAADLLARPDAATLDVPHDSSYGHAMTYRAVPLRDLLAELPPNGADTIEARATDGFASQLPRGLIEGAAVPWIAVEDSAHPWPHLRGKTVSAGPFYLVWQNPEAAGVGSEQWPYALAALAEVASPVQRWPAIAVAASLPPDAPARRGQAVFIANCLPCHRLGGNGQGSVGPDLLDPMPAVAYFTEPGLRALIRNPSSVRHWPAQQMPGFSAADVSDADIDAIIAYLRYLSVRPR
ncbi:MAG TPA: cytochrome c [Acetobacteraceae bacterium]|nr:cytochrome c [Acetobacteraceae bacterium]